MLKKIIFPLFLFLLYITEVSAQLRTFEDIFPNIDEDIRAAAFTEAGFLNVSRQADRQDLIAVSSPNVGLDRQKLNAVLGRNPRYLVESITVIPAEGGFVSLLDVYNALSNIRGLAGILYDSHSRGRPVPLFEEATRIVGERQTSAIPDPPPASIVPPSETIFVRLRDANFGNTFYRADMEQAGRGLFFTLTNFRNLTYLLIPVVREGNLIAQLYVEPIYEGVLIYGIIGANISNFVSSRIHMNSAISKRLEVIMTWATNSIKANM